MPTAVFCHAHPDDEALLTAGTMAKASAAGHRVVLVMATDGAAGLARSDVTDLAATRARELTLSTRALGVARTVLLGYADSGLDATVQTGFSHVPVAEVADRIARVVDEEQADILVGYDPFGGYGHPDHRHLHAAVRDAWRTAHRRPTLFEATLPREPIAKAAHLAHRLHLTPKGFDPAQFDEAWTRRRLITHRVDVRAHMPAKRAALTAHASQAGADDGVRTLQVLGRLPMPVLRALLGTEYYVEVASETVASSRSGAL